MGQYSELISKIENSCDYELERIMLHEIKNINLDIDKSIIYIQNLFVYGKLPILYSFSAEKIIRISIKDEEEHILNVQCYNKFEISNFAYDKECYRNIYKIYFSMNNDIYTLDPAIDTNRNHVDNYNEIASEIVKYFSN